MTTRILVIDDAPHNVASAHLTLKGLDYTVVDTVKEGFEALSKENAFDILLTDLWMPRGDFIGAIPPGSVDQADTVIPAGLVFAIRAANIGMHAVIVTDSDHHRDRICSVLDLVNRADNKDKQLVKYIEARWDHIGGAKNWRAAAKRAGIELTD
jgi:DNA-binding NarL/FixJ family response regulator